MPNIFYGSDLDAEGLTQKDLLEQICLRLDRHFPNAASQKEATQALDAAKVVLNEAADTVAASGMVELAATLRGLIE